MAAERLQWLYEMKILSIIIAATALATWDARAEEETAEPALLPSEQVGKRLIAAPRPEYPYEARRLNLAGSGVAELRVDKSGQVSAARMQQTTGSVILDDAALSALRRWQFTPGDPFVFQTPITFEMAPPPPPPPVAPQTAPHRVTIAPARVTPSPKTVRRPAPRPKPRVGDISNPEAEKPPFVGMTKDQALARYGRPKKRTVTEEGEQWVYVLNMGEIIGKAFIPFNFKPTLPRTGVLIFGPDGTVKKFTWDTDKHD